MMFPMCRAQQKRYLKYFTVKCTLFSDFNFGKVVAIIIEAQWEANQAKSSLFLMIYN